MNGTFTLNRFMRRQFKILYVGATVLFFSLTSLPVPLAKRYQTSSTCRPTPRCGPG